MESRVARLQRRRQVQREWQDRWISRVAEALVLASLLYLLVRSPFGRTLVDGVSSLVLRRNA